MHRRAHLDDLDALLPLVQAFCEADQHSFDEARIVAALRPLLVDDSVGQVWVVDLAGELTGYAIVTWSYSLESGGRDCILDEIFVATPGAGVGGGLLDAAMEGARSQGARAIFLETEAHNERARSFYRRHGFEMEPSIWLSRPLPPVG